MTGKFCWFALPSAAELIGQAVCAGLSWTPSEPVTSTSEVVAGRAFRSKAITEEAGAVTPMMTAATTAARRVFM